MGSIKLAAANVAAMEVQHQAKTPLEQAINHNAGEERADIRVSDAMPKVKNRRSQVLLEIGRQMTLQHE